MRLGEHGREVRAAFPECKHLLETAAATLGAANWSRTYSPTRLLDEMFNSEQSLLLSGLFPLFAGRYDPPAAADGTSESMNTSPQSPHAIIESMQQPAGHRIFFTLLLIGARAARAAAPAA